ncbi:31 kDa ribonucleoprotein, chloroplastic [Artemisia annua]|uniref:31 kDa ribonucleoprotein, chloroplastic n=1 Tax=Artemisia annua TaxID=35608 RepID=A0A2U1L310_ARTAN|nr:31 kDa ribonucleoprotein, chloroplastic [Artemisia annua]
MLDSCSVAINRNTRARVSIFRGFLCARIQWLKDPSASAFLLMLVVQRDDEKDGKELGPGMIRVFCVKDFRLEDDDRKLGPLFSSSGTVDIAKVIYNKDSDQSRGFGFVIMSTIEKATKRAFEELYMQEGPQVFYIIPWRTFNLSNNQRHEIWKVVEKLLTDNQVCEVQTGGDVSTAVVLYLAEREIIIKDLLDADMNNNGFLRSKEIQTDDVGRPDSMTVAPPLGPQVDGIVVLGEDGFNTEKISCLSNQMQRRSSKSKEKGGRKMEFSVLQVKENAVGAEWYGTSIVFVFRIMLFGYMLMRVFGTVCRNCLLADHAAVDSSSPVSAQL